MIMRFTKLRGGYSWGPLLWDLSIDDFTTQQLEKHFS